MRSVRILVAGALVLTLAGCGPVDDAQHVIDRSKLVNEMASRLDRGSTLTYTAEYELPDGSRATVAQAQEPIRASYTYPTGKFVTTTLLTMDCRAEAQAPGALCSITPPPTPKSDTGGLFVAMRERGLVPPTLVIGLLTAASLSSDAAIQRSETTIAGQAATCVQVSGVRNAPATDFDACITDNGVLGSFDGTVDDKDNDVSLVRYESTVAPDAFDPPAGAKTVDNRPPTD
jgi:hypothetical protein